MASRLEGSRGPRSRRARRGGDPGRPAGAERQGGRRNLGCFPGGQGQLSRVIRALPSASAILAASPGPAPGPAFAAAPTPGWRRESATTKLGRGSAWTSQKPRRALDPASFPGVLGNATPVAAAKAGLHSEPQVNRVAPACLLLFAPYSKSGKSEALKGELIFIKSVPSALIICPHSNPRRWVLLSSLLHKGGDGGRAGKEEATAGRQSHSSRRGLGSLKILLPALVSFWGGGWGQCCSPC
uniref:uncharacterized protein LOC114679588 isoform X2 n=1 Tax=Macaca mulatta TaxID=9544 RepID=UPI0010A29E64|nr:uncharacterized protein LOC114679588 isoform X2 [Macaca mulatta]